MEFSRQEYWSGLSFPSPGIFLTQGLNPSLPHYRQTLYHLSPQGSPKYLIIVPSFLKNTLIYQLLVPSLGEGNSTPLQYSCLENPMDGGAWWAATHGVTKSRTRLSDFTFTFHFHALEKEMATHSSFLAWRIPGTREPGGLPFMRSHRVGHG